MKKHVILPLLFLTFQAIGQTDSPKGLKVGDTAPLFKTTDFAGNKLELSELLQKGKVIVLFYRGAWCPYCNRYMSELQKNATKFAEKGVSVIAITPETNEYVAEMIDKTKTSFSVVYDQDRSLMTQFDVLYKMDEKMQEKFKDYKIDIDKRNGADDHVLPVPATYIIGKNGKIDFVHFDPNFKVRANIEDILANL
jgi:peroxiredoxin